MLTKFLAKQTHSASKAFYRIVHVATLALWATYAIAVSVPAASDWVDQGTIIAPGQSGSWDANLGGSISPATVIKKNGIFYLYYVAADGFRADGGPRHRAMGVATSNDGVNFTKHPSNPILTYKHKTAEDAGVFSAGATLDASGNVVLYYAACDGVVNCDGRVATSSNGIDFTDIANVLPWNGPVWGAGDELFPVGAYTHNGNWYVYYIAKNSSFEWQLGLASGTSMSSLPNTQAVLTNAQIIGGFDPVRVSANEILLFGARDFGSWQIDVRLITPDAPQTLKAPILTYDFSNARHVTPFYDSDTNTWFMYYLNDAQDEIRVKTTGNSSFVPDTLSPASPTSLQAK